MGVNAPASVTLRPRRGHASRVLARLSSRSIVRCPSRGVDACRRVLGDNDRKPLNELFTLPRFSQGTKAVDLPSKLTMLYSLSADTSDRLVHSLLRPFRREIELFNQLLAGALPDELQLDISLGFEPVKFDQVSGELDDAHRLTHVEHERVARACHRGGLQNQLHGLRNRHEV